MLIYIQVKGIKKSRSTGWTPNKRLFTQTLKSDCIKYTNISIFTFQVFSHKNSLNENKEIRSGGQ